MNLIKWDPFRELEDVSTRLNRIFGRPLVRSESGNELLAMADWAPSVDISETDAAYLIKGEIPGVKKEDVKVTIQDGMLTIQGERRDVLAAFHFSPGISLSLLRGGAER